MAYASLRACVEELERTGRLRRLDFEVDGHLEAAAIARRVQAHQGPALWFTRLKGCRFTALGNLFGTLERARFILRHGLSAVEAAMAARSDPLTLLRLPRRTLGLTASLPNALCRRTRRAPLLRQRCRVSELPQIVGWPRDAGAFVTLPLVYTEDQGRPGWLRSNLGMYRVQLGGNEYVSDQEVGLHYQIHRGIGIHHQRALELGQPLEVAVLVGGPPALTLAAVMPLPEGMPELALAGLLHGAPLHLAAVPGFRLGLVAEADFCILGRVHPGRVKPEGPFGDHLGYYSLAHDFPVLEVATVFHRPDAIWPFTTVGRPPQEDSIFGELIHEMTGPVIRAVIPGVHQIHAVDAAGVHPLLLAQASERYTPYQERHRPQELLTAANAILGQGQLSLAKYLWICAREDNPSLSVQDVEGFFRHMLERVDWRHDLHFQTQTTMDTLDYTGGGLNQGSKVVIAAVGSPRRNLPTRPPQSAPRPAGFGDYQLVLPGILVLQGPAYRFDVSSGGDPQLMELERLLDPEHPFSEFPLLVVVDRLAEAAGCLRDFIWVTFTRSDPAADLYGRSARVYQKHWGCSNPLVIDARRKPHHADPLEEDPAVTARVEGWARRGGPLHGLF